MCGLFLCVCGLFLCGDRDGGGASFWGLLLCVFVDCLLLFFGWLIGSYLLIYLIT